MKVWMMGLIGAACCMSLHATPALFAFDNGFSDVPAYEDQAKLLKKLGYDGICTRPRPDTAKLLAAFDKQDLDVMATYVVLPMKNPEIPEFVKHHIELLKGRDTIIWLSLTGKSSDEAAAELVRKVYQLAKANGLETVIYPHINFRIDTVASAEKIRKLADCPDLGISFNVCHFLAQNPEDKLEETIRSVGPHLKLVQISGANMIPEPKSDWKNLILPLGEGDFDMNRVFQTLEEVGYQGDYNLQCYKVPGPAEEHLTKSINAWRKYNEQP